MAMALKAFLLIHFGDWKNSLFELLAFWGCRLGEFSAHYSSSDMKYITVIAWAASDDGFRLWMMSKANASVSPTYACMRRKGSEGRTRMEDPYGGKGTTASTCSTFWTWAASAPPSFLPSFRQLECFGGGSLLFLLLHRIPPLPPSVRPSCLQRNYDEWR